MSDENGHVFFNKKARVATKLSEGGYLDLNHSVHYSGIKIAKEFGITAIGCACCGGELSHGLHITARNL